MTNMPDESTQVDLNGEPVRVTAEQKSKTVTTYTVFTTSAKASFTREAWEAAVEDEDEPIDPKIFIQRRMKVTSKDHLEGRDWADHLDALTEQAISMMGA